MKDLLNYIVDHVPGVPQDLLECNGMNKLCTAVKGDLINPANFTTKPDGEKYYYHDHLGKLIWVVKRVLQYADRTGLKPHSILNTWERYRDYWYMNYYQEEYFPDVKSKDIYFFKTMEETREKLGIEFICPNCSETVNSPCECPHCGWKSYGLFGTGGKGMYVFVLEKMRGQNIFRSKNFPPEYKVCVAPTSKEM